MSDALQLSQDGTGLQLHPDGDALAFDDPCCCKVCNGLDATSMHISIEGFVNPAECVYEQPIFFPGPFGSIIRVGTATTTTTYTYTILNGEYSSAHFLVRADQRVTVQFDQGNPDAGPGSPGAGAIVAFRRYSQVSDPGHDVGFEGVVREEAMLLYAIIVDTICCDTGIEDDANSPTFHDDGSFACFGLACDNNLSSGYSVLYTKWKRTYDYTSDPEVPVWTPWEADPFVNLSAPNTILNGEIPDGGPTSVCNLLDFAHGERFVPNVYNVSLSGNFFPVDCVHTDFSVTTSYGVVNPDIHVDVYGP